MLKENNISTKGDSFDGKNLSRANSAHVHGTEVFLALAWEVPQPQITAGWEKILGSSCLYGT